MRSALFDKLIEEHKQRQEDVAAKYEEKFEAAENEEALK